MGLLPQKLVCCQKKPRQIYMETARAALEKGIDIVELFRFRRFVRLALEHLLDLTLHAEMNSRS